MLGESPFSYGTVPLLNPSTEIRLLDLYPASDYTDDLYCTIYMVPISQAPSYIALSYVWGDSTRSHSISVANEVNDGRVFVPLSLTSSLDTCLRHLRELQRRWQLEPRPLWIDQICINQEDDEEKSFQVLLMRDIYSSAHQTVVWLGPAADGSDRVMDTFAEIGQQFHDEIGVPFSDERMLPVSRLIEENIERPGVVALLSKAFRDVSVLKREGFFTRWVNRPWFKRVWTIQEFCLCSDTVFSCGYKVVPARLFYTVNDFTRCISMDSSLLELLQTHDTPTHSILAAGFLELHRLFQRRGHVQYLHQKETLEHLLVEIFVGCTPSYANDKRDKVYGLLGLARDADELGIRPDYSSSTTVAHVLTRTARAIIHKNMITKRGRGLLIIRYGSLGRRPSAQLGDVKNTTGEMELPSWVPEWNNKTKKTYVANMSFSACGRFKAADLLPTSSPTILGVRGFYVDTIVDLGDKAETNHLHYHDGPKKILSFFGSFKRLFNLSKQNQHAKGIYATTAQHDTALWRVPIGDQNIAYGVDEPPERGGPKVESLHRRFIAYYEDWARREDDWKEYITAYEAGDEKAKLAMQLHLDKLLVEGYWLALGNMTGKKPFLTKYGYLGMGPGHAQPGDKVVVFHGDVIPYVVRPLPEKGDGMYLLMGEAYCDGVMDGELAETAEREEFYLI